MADSAATHPGEILKTEFLDPLGISQYRLARGSTWRRTVSTRSSTANAVSASTPHCGFRAHSG